jgi:dienelactone hydrolase
MRKLAMTALVVLAACGGPASPGGDDGDDGGDDGGGDDDGGAVDAHSGAIDGDVDPVPDAAGGETVTDPGLPGTWGVHAVNGTASTDLGTAQITTYSPSSDGGTTPAAGPFPLVIVSTGYQIGRASYEDTCRHLASWGYIVVSHDYTSGNHQEKAAEIGDLIDDLVASLGSRVDATEIAGAGHSMGGKVSINAAILDSRIDAVIGWDPVDALPPFSDGSTSVTPEQMGGLTVPLAVLGETTDTSCAPTADDYARFFEAACNAPAALEVTIPGADHTDWVDDRQSCGFACFVCATGATADATTLEITRRVTTAWLETHLRHRTGFDAYLASPGAPATVRTAVPGC